MVSNAQPATRCELPRVAHAARPASSMGISAWLGRDTGCHTLAHFCLPSGNTFQEEPVCHCMSLMRAERLSRGPTPGNLPPPESRPPWTQEAASPATGSQQVCRSGAGEVRQSMPQWGLEGGHTCRGLARGTGARCENARQQRRPSAPGSAEAGKQHCEHPPREGTACGQWGHLPAGGCCRWHGCTCHTASACFQS